VGEDELRSSEPVAGGSEPFEGSEWQCQGVGEDELRSSEPVAGGSEPFEGSEWHCRGVTRLLLVPVIALLSACMPPSWGANALLHPQRRPVKEPPARPFEKVDYDVGVKLVGWRFPTDRPRRGTVIYLHGLGDNRGSSLGIANHFTTLGFDVVAYDGRALGESGGDACTYGYYEKQDLRGVIDRLPPGPIVTFGVSLGAAVALQAAAEDPRISVVVAVSTFSDLRTAVNERAPFFASRGNIEKARVLAEAEGRFRVDDVSPAAAAARIHAPVIVVHGADDRETPPAHSERVFAALAGPKQIVRVAGAGHHDTLTPETWRQIDAWVDAHLPAAR
jgi:pimeloyl-ACP methyl ester carboxylesterase